MSGTLNPYRHQYETVAASQTNQVLGNTGAVGDFLHRIVVSVTDKPTCSFSVIDGSTTIFTVANNTQAVGIYNLEFNIASQNGPWKITTAAGATVVGIGTFTN